MTRVERQPLLGRRRPGAGGRSPLAAAARVLAALVLSALAGLVVVAFASQAVGFSAHVVTSGSMAPRVQPGDLVLTRATTAAALRPGQVLLFADPDRPGGLLLHRLVSFDPAGKLVTRGDANPSDDSVHVAPSAVRGVARLRVPWVGLPAVWRLQGRFGLIALAAALLAGAALFVARARGRRATGGALPQVNRVEPGSSGGPRPPMTGAGSPATPRTAAPRSAGLTGVAGVTHDTVVIERVVQRVVERPTRAPRGTGSTEEDRGSASSAGYVLPPVPRPAAGGGRPAGPAGRRHGRGGDHSGCFDGGNLCRQSGR